MIYTVWMDKEKEFEIDVHFPFESYRPHQQETIFKVLDEFEKGTKFVVGLYSADA